MFPVPEFEEIEPRDTEQDVAMMEEEGADSVTCFGCQTTLNVEQNLTERCRKCDKPFCIECNVFIHESLHNCPGCMSVARH